MSRYLIDTDICVSFLRGAQGVRERFRDVGYDRCSISQITLAELLFGVHRSADPGKNRKKLDVFLIDIGVVPISHDTVEVFAKEKARLTALGIPVADFDLFIGATAIDQGMTLVTNNTRHFSRLQNIKLETWI